MADRIVIKSGIERMQREFDQWVDENIESTKAELRELVQDYATFVRDVNTPIGPPHRKDIQEGNLRRSVTVTEFDHGSYVAWHGSIGGVDADYVRYVAARDGVDLLAGFDAFAEAGDQIMSGER